jgi:hypothetical protein
MARLAGDRRFGFAPFPNFNAGNPLEQRSASRPTHAANLDPDPHRWHWCSRGHPTIAIIASAVAVAGKMLASRYLARRDHGRCLLDLFRHADELPLVTTLAPKKYADCNRQCRNTKVR